MKHILLLSYLVYAITAAAGPTDPKGFIPNMGQVHDQYYKPNPDVLFGGKSSGLVFHLKQKGISYQFCRTTEQSATIYRIDITWMNALTGEVIPGTAGGDLNHFYNEICPKGILNVPTLTDVTYKNIYPNTDLRWYFKEGALKYDYIAAAGADPSQIKMKIEGAEKIYIGEKGELMIKTPLGILAEDAPVVIQNGKVLSSCWKITGNTVGFEIKSLDPHLCYIIDPQVRLWATYYGGTGNDENRMMASDGSGNIFLGGNTNSASSTEIATLGSHQASIGGGTDCFLVKFDAAGVRQWGTYYGGTPSEYMRGGCTDGLGNVFICGQTVTTTAGIIATPGSHQDVFGGGDDAFLVKFDGNGVRQWGTYYGGGGYDYGFSCAADGAGNVYLAGMVYQQSYSYTNEIATPGSHQPVHGDGNLSYDGFLVKFNSSGVRQWGTYYGGLSEDRAYDVYCDPSGSMVCLAGNTKSTNGTTIATTGSHQQTHNGGVWDAFLALFDANGTRQWGTYYGGSDGEDDFSVCAMDGAGNIVLGGWTASLNGISTVSGHQMTFGGDRDGFLSLFNNAGVLQWGSYYGGTGWDEINDILCVGSLIYACGETATGTSGVISTTGSYQASIGGNTDAFLTSFSMGGTRQWGTYYGSSGWEYGYRCAPGGNGTLYLAGETTSSTNITTTGSHQELYGGGSVDAYLVKFCDGPAAPANTSNPTSQSICYGNSTSLSATGTGTMGWYDAFSGGNYLGGGNTFITPALTTTTTYYVQDSTCTGGPRTAITVTVNPLPVVVYNELQVLACVNWTAYTLTAGTPPGGTYSGTSVTGNQFDPGSAGAGTFAIVYTYTDGNGCTDSDTSMITVDLCTGINGPSESANMTFYPNPATDFLEMSVADFSHVTLMDGTGRRVMEGEIQAGITSWDISSLAPGIYFLHFGSKAVRLIIE